MADNHQREQYDILVNILSNPDIAEGQIEPAFRSITETCGGTLDVHRVTIWRSTSRETEYRCVEAYDRDQKTHTSGETLEINHYPSFYTALLRERIIRITNTAEDPRTPDLHNDYWKPHHTAAALCVPLWIRGRLGGFATFEKNLPVEGWRADQESFACQAGDLIVNTLLSAQNQELRQQLDLYETSLNQITQGSDPDSVLHDLVRYATQLLDCDCGLVFTNDFRRQECCCTVSYNAPEAYTKAVLNYGEDVVGTVAETGQTLILHQYQQWPERSTRFPTDGYSEVIAVPLRSGGKIRGVLELMRKGENRSFVDWDRRMLEMLAKQVTLAFEQVHQGAKQVREQGHRKAVHRMVDIAAESTDLTHMIDTSLELILECMALTKGSIHVRPLISGRGLTLEEENKIYHVLDRDGEGFTASIGIGDWKDYSGALSEIAPFMKKMDIRASLFVPILAGSTYLGCICIHAPSPRTWSEMGVHQVQTIARIIAIAADKLSAHQFIDTHTRLMDRLTRINRGLNRLFTFDEAVQRVGQGAVQLLEANQAAIFMRNPDGSFTCPWSHGLPEPALKRIVETENSELAKTMLASTTPISYPELKGLRLPAQFRKLLGAEGIQSLIFLPMVFSGELIGAICCCFRVRRELSAAERSVVEAFSSQAALALQNAWMHAQMEEGYTDVALALARAMDARDSSISDSSLQVAEWAEETGQRLGLSEQEIKDLHWAALLHNIGKISVPDIVLQKPGLLSEEEWRVVQQYPIKGAELIQPLTRFHNVSNIIRHSRERFDGSGYPDRRRGDDIPLASRVLSVADAFTSMLEDRPYRKARNPQEAIQELERESGTQFDPEVVLAFVEAVKSQKGGNGKRTGRHN